MAICPAAELLLWNVISDSFCPVRAQHTKHAEMNAHSVLYTHTQKFYLTFFFKFILRNAKFCWRKSYMFCKAISMLSFL
jgi:hypothetical protein